MTITREQVADLQPGDVVELRNPSYTSVTVRGPLRADRGGSLWLAAYVVRFPDGEPGMPEWPLTVVSRASRPLYVNHPRTELVTGDVVGDGDVGGHPQSVWIVNTGSDDLPWFVNADCEWITRAELPARLRLLVDGETGRCVQ